MAIVGDREITSSKAVPKAYRASRVLVLTEDTKSQEERDIAELVNAAYDKGILDKGKSQPRGDGYYDLYFKDTDGSMLYYSVRFGGDPDLKMYPKSERAIRASGFVEKLLERINAKYNCYIVLSAIETVDADAVRRRLFAKEDNVIVTLDTEQSRSLEEAGSRQYELEVAIVAAIDKGDGQSSVYRRMTDNVVLVVREEKLERVEHAELEHNRTASDIKITVDDKKNAKKIFELLESDETKLKILEAVSEPVLPTREWQRCTNEFYEFLQAAAEMDTSLVGQVSVHPSFLFIDALPEKTFVYSVEMNGLKASLAITWNGTARDFENAPLYIMTNEEGDFAGLTFDKDKGQSFNPEEDKLVVVPSGEKGEAAVTVACRTNLAVAEDRYKGVCNYAVSVSAEDITDGVREKYYARSGAIKSYPFSVKDTEQVKRTYGNVRCHRLDCKESDYDDKGYFIEDLKPAEYFIVADGIRKARMQNKNGALVPKSLNSYTCKNCGAEIYSSEADWEAYAEAHMLCDGTNYCDNCLKSRSLKVLFDLDEETRLGYILVPESGGREDETVKEVKVVGRYDERAGTATKCKGADCGKYLFLPPEEESGKSEVSPYMFLPEEWVWKSEVSLYTCDCCGNFLNRGKKCVMNEEFRNKQKSSYLPEDWVICEVCKTIEFEKKEKLVKAKKENEGLEKEIKTLEDQSEQEKQFLDNIIYGKKDKGLYTHLRYMRFGDRRRIKRAVRKLSPVEKRGGAGDGHSPLSRWLSFTTFEWVTVDKSDGENKERGNVKKRFNASYKLNVGKRSYRFVCVKGKVTFGGEE